jgi:cupin superfamily acireductone dioxygenase involved in methionine salvage
MNIYEDKDCETKINRITDQMGYLILDLLYMSVQKLNTENQIFQELLEARLQAHMENPITKPQNDPDIHF